ncbi:sister chromatid cohesion 1 protein 2 isoform X2 [Hibiscus syriacus]|uniref:sister chromatid cohesion 1 protein 2 isoform X2 n=1 Tax=Hibiscus syriacus TaxID=106335 RepID=UPI0019220F47|nr:sister chromatid cohesion 1 protein 2 isoform X2 [Hibiscus syriacus]
MFISKCLVSKKGPLGAIWLAAFLFTRLKKSQILEINISSSVDTILQSQLEILAYRVLAYLLVGVVRIYSKKVEYLFEDCQEVLVEINQFVVREKNRAKKEALRATSFSITRPVSFDLDAFDLEVLEDTSRDNVVPREEITLKDVAWENAGKMRYSLDRIAALDDAFLMDYTLAEDSLSRHQMDFETEVRTLHGVCDPEASVEKLRCDNSFLEEISHIKTVGGVEEEPQNLVNENERERVEVPDMAGLVNQVGQEANREKYNDRLLSEKWAILHTEAREDSPVPHKLEPLAEDQTNRELIKGPDQLESENEMNQAMEEDYESVLEASAELPDISGSVSMEKCSDRFTSERANLCNEAEEEPLRPAESLVEDQGNREKMKDLSLLQYENEVHRVIQEDHVSMEASVEVPGLVDSEIHIRRESSRENNIDELCQEECLNLIVQVEEKSPGLVKPVGEEETNRDMKGSYRVQPENEIHHVMKEDQNFETSTKKLQAEEFFHMDIQEPTPLVRPLAEEIHTDAEHEKFPAKRTKDGKCQAAAKNRTLSVTLDSTPQSVLQDASGATTPHFMLIPTPARKEHSRFSRKRKCVFDDVIVYSNDIMRQWIKDASDLVSKRVKDGRTAIGAKKTRWILNLPQSFSEPSVPCNFTIRNISTWYFSGYASLLIIFLTGTLELKSIYCGKRLRLLESINITKPSDHMDTPEPPMASGFVEQAEITPMIVEIRDPPDMLNLSKSPPFDESTEHAGISPQTPIQQSTSLIVEERTEIAPQTPLLHSKSVRPFVSPKDLKCNNLGGVRPENVDPTQIMGKEPSLNEIIERSSLNKNEDRNLDLDIHSNEDSNQEKDGWSSRTRMVAKRLQRSFQDQKNKGEEEKVNLSQLLEGRTKKASVKVFYEILVLKTKGLVDVQQEDGFGDIIVLKSSKWDESVLMETMLIC